MYWGSVFPEAQMPQIRPFVSAEAEQRQDVGWGCRPLHLVEEAKALAVRRWSLSRQSSSKVTESCFAVKKCGTFQMLVLGHERTLLTSESSNSREFLEGKDVETIPCESLPHARLKAGRQS